MEQPTGTFWIQQIIEERARQGFYGKLVFSFQNGRVVLVEVNQTIKPPSEDRRSGYSN